MHIIRSHIVFSYAALYDAHIFPVRQPNLKVNESIMRCKFSFGWMLKNASNWLAFWLANNTAPNHATYDSMHDQIDINYSALSISTIRPFPSKQLLAHKKNKSILNTCKHAVFRIHKYNSFFFSTRGWYRLKGIESFHDIVIGPYPPPSS